MKKCILFLLSFFFTAALSAQVSVDPSDLFYAELERWEIMGLVEPQPQLRPYPAEKVKSVLNQVMNSDDATESARASDLYDRLFYRAVKIKAYGEFNGELEDDSGFDKQLLVLIGLDGDYSFPKWVSLGYKLNLVGATNSTASALPVYGHQPYYMHDGVAVGPLDAYIECDGGLAVGTERLYAQAGVNHTGFGPFYADSVVLSPTAKHTANLSFTYSPGRWSYSQMLMGLSASDTKNAPLSFKGNDLYSNKYLYIHSIEASPFRWLSLSFYETVIFGGRFDPSYLVPMFYMVTQGITGYDDDNVLMGFNFVIKPVRGLSFLADFYVDDVETSELLKLNFDTKIRAAMQAGVKFVPQEHSFVKKLSLDYTLITPYMYAHRQNSRDSVTGNYVTVGTGGANYQEYTTAGLPLGSYLEPNSDRIQLSADFAVSSGWTFSLFGTFIRHGNVNESLTTQEMLNYLNYSHGTYFATDGSINNHTNQFESTEGAESYDSEYLDSAWNRLMFLTQATKMYVFQAGFEVTKAFPRVKAGQFSVSLGYTFEYIHNYGVSEHIFIGQGRWNDDGSFTPGTCTEADVDAALAAWRANLRNLINNYAGVSVKWVF